MTYEPIRSAQSVRVTKKYILVLLITIARTKGARRNFLRGSEILRKIFCSHQSTGYLVYYNIYVIFAISILTQQRFS